MNYTLRLVFSVKIQQMEVHILFGPTRAGKTKKAQDLWHEYHYPILSVDSRKVYKGMDIGTNKLQALNFIEQNPSVIYGGLDFISPTQKISVYEYQQEAYRWLSENESEILEKGGLILHGGTGLYLDAVLNGLSLKAPSDESFRECADSLSTEELQSIARQEDLSAYEIMNDSDVNNPRRLVRLIENARWEKEGKRKDNAHRIFTDAKQIWYELQSDRNTLYKNINARVERYLEEGWIKEVETLLLSYEPQDPGLRVMGYKQIVGFMYNYPDWKKHVAERSELFEELLESIRKQHRNYAKRQITWGKKYQGA